MPSVIPGSMCEVFPVGDAAAGAPMRLWLAAAAGALLIAAVTALAIVHDRRASLAAAERELHLVAARAAASAAAGLALRAADAEAGLAFSLRAPGEVGTLPSDRLAACEPVPPSGIEVCVERALAPVLRGWRIRTDAMIAAALAAMLGVLAGAIGARNARRRVLLRHAAEDGRLAELEVAIERLPVGVAVFDREGRLTVANGRFGEILDLPAEICRAGVSLRTILRHQADRGEFGPAAAAAPDAEAAARFARVLSARELRTLRQRPDGRWIEIRRGPTPDGGIAIVYHDITAQRLAEEAARLAHAHLEEAIAIVPVSFSLWDCDDRLVLFNRQFLEVNPYLTALPDAHGITYETMVRLGHAAGHILFPGTDDLEAAIAARVRLHRLPPGAAYERQQGDGRWYLVRSHATADGGLVQVALEITRLKRVEAELVDRVAELELSQRRLAEQAGRLAELAADYARARDEAEEGSRAKSRFLANMSHELRTPLNAIIGFSEIIKAELLGPVGAPQYADYAADIHASGQHLLDLINDLLDMSKIEAGRYELRPEELDLREAAGEVWRMLAVVAERRAVAVEVPDVPADGAARGPAAPLVEADRRALRQILLNLMSNALKFTEAGGRVRVAVSSDPETAELVVEDNGIGMSSETLARIGQPFEQADNELSRRHEGTGLGLALSRALVELHGGTLKIESVAGRGTTVRVRLPRQGAIAAHGRAAPVRQIVAAEAGVRLRRA